MDYSKEQKKWEKIGCITVLTIFTVGYGFIFFCLFFYKTVFPLVIVDLIGHPISLFLILRAYISGYKLAFQEDILTEIRIANIYTQLIIIARDYLVYFGTLYALMIIIFHFLDQGNPPYSIAIILSIRFYSDKFKKGFDYGKTGISISA